MKYWMVRSDGSFRDEVEEGGFIAVGFGGERIGNLTGCDSDEIRKRVEKLRPNVTPAKIRADAGNLYRFANALKIGDRVITGIRDRQYLVGTITSDYTYVESDADHPHRRSLKWQPNRLNRDQMTPRLKNSLGGQMTVFEITKHAGEIARLLGEEPPTQLQPDRIELEEAGDFGDISYVDDIEQRARERINDLILDQKRFDGHEFEWLIAALLKAMGFKIVREPQPGTDGGIDIIAAPDVFGFEQPRIIVQVKHRAGKSGLAEVQRFAESLQSGEKGLFVSTGGFDRNARNKRDRNVTLLDGEKIVEYFIAHYEDVPPEYQAKVPLRRVYLPVPPDED